MKQSTSLLGIASARVGNEISGKEGLHFSPFYDIMRQKKEVKQMERSKRITKHRMIAFLAALLIPTLAMALGVILLLTDILWNISFIVSFLVLPAGMILLLALLMFSNKKRFLKVILTLLLMTAFIIVFLGATVFGKFEALSLYTDEELAEHYAKVENNFAPMPTLSQIGDPTETAYYDYFLSLMGIFTWDADYLICRYDATAYNEQIRLINDRYIFQQDDIITHGYCCEPIATINGYTFRMLPVEGEYGAELQYPKRLVFIATNAEIGEIIYLSFYNDDLDYIDSTVNFIYEDCGWKHIR